MNRKKRTKYALMASFSSLCLSIAMLLGTTYAWFTDTASAAVNRIEAGTLDVALQYATSWNTDGTPAEWANAEGQTLNWKASSESEEETVTWEPGCTYELPELRIFNNGNLALKYRIEISGIKGDAELNNVIVWTVSVGEEGLADENAVGNMLETERQLSSGEFHVLTISGKMKDDAADSYQGLSIDGIAITVVAVQDTGEYDSTDNQYDADRVYPVVNFQSLKSRLQEGGTISFGKSILVPVKDIGTDLSRDINPQLQLSGDTVLELNGNRLAFDAETVQGKVHSLPVLIEIANGTALTINGGGTIDADAGDHHPAHCFYVNGGALVINGGNYKGAPMLFEIDNGSVEINDGFFSSTELYNTFLCYVLSGTVTIKGGTFVNMKPQPYVADGYAVITEQKGETEFWYTVVPTNE